MTLKAFPQALPGGGTIGTYGVDDSVTVVWPDRLRRHRATRSASIPSTTDSPSTSVSRRLDSGTWSGCLGNADGNKTNDLVTRAGQPVTFPNTPFAELYGTYVNSWRISQAESLFDYDAGKTTADFTDLTFPDAPATPQNLPAAALDERDQCLRALRSDDSGDARRLHRRCRAHRRRRLREHAAAAQEAGLGIPSNTGGSSIGVGDDGDDDDAR